MATAMAQILKPKTQASGGSVGYGSVLPFAQWDGGPELSELLPNPCVRTHQLACEGWSRYRAGIEPLLSLVAPHNQQQQLEHHICEH